MLTKIAPYQLALLLRTLKPLSLKQLFYLFRQRIQSLAGLRVKSLAPCFRVHADFSCITGIKNKESRLVDGKRFCFINEDKDISEVLSARWRPEASRLWLYNVHYFDFLKDEELEAGLQDRLALQLIENWYDSNPQGTVDAWDPYPISLRIVNWIKYIHAVKGRNGEIPRWMLASLGIQVKVLEVSVEYHLRGNHLFKNAVALFFAGMFFDGTDALRWRAKGTDLLITELEAQFLDDGGHVERTPTYHALCIEDCLDCLNLAQAMPDRTTAALCEALNSTVARGLIFLAAVTLPDGSLAAFSDTAPGIAASTEQLFEYAKQLGVEYPAQRSKELDPIELSDSGYYGYRKGDEYLLLDCGPMGVTYQPGHAHCDLLSFEWVLDGKKVLVDSGVFNYFVSPERRFCRSTASHNTVMVDGQEQGEIWSAFRLGRRPGSFKASVSVNDSTCSISGEHDAYRYLPGGVRHRRRLTRIFPQSLSVRDELEGAGQHYAVTRFHFAAGYQLVDESNDLFLCEHGGQRVMRIITSAGLVTRIVASEYFPAFGRRKVNAVLELEWRGQLPASWDCCFEIINKDSSINDPIMPIADFNKVRGL